VPHGGNTGLAGGSVPVYDEVVLSLQRLNEVLQVDVNSGTAVVQAGVTLKQLDDALAPQVLHLCLLQLCCSGVA
jgi:FAD/FMN-containing dehydrogenase